MVLRTSNGYPFIVLAPAATVRTGIRVEVYDRDDPDTLIDVLPDTRNRQWLDELNDIGSGSFDIATNDQHLADHPDILTYGNIVRFYLNNVLRAAFLIESIDRTQAKEPGDSARWLTVSGRGPLALLESGVAYPQGGLGGNPNRGFPGITPGHLMRVLLQEWQTRGGGIGVTWSFTDLLDSYSAPYAQTITITERAGIDLLRLASRHAELAVDVYMHPALRLDYYNTRGVDKTITTTDTGAVVLQLGHNITELTNRETGRITNLLLIETPAGYLERSHGGSITTYNRREGFLSLGNTGDSDTVDLASDAIFARLADPAGAATLEIIEAPGRMPYEDFDVGDWVLAPNAQGDLEKVRVRALSVSETPDGRVRYIPELSTIEEELEGRLNRWLESMAKGTLGGSGSEISEPNTISGTTVTSEIGTGIGDHLAGQPHLDEFADLADTNLAGLADKNFATYDLASGKWVPIGRAGINANELGSGAAPASRVLTADGAGAANWLPTAGGGGAVPSYLARITTRPDAPTAYDDEFPGSALDVKWTQVVLSGTSGLTVGNDHLRIAPANTGGTSFQAILQPFTPLAAPITIEGCFVWNVWNTNFLMFGLVFTDGVISTSKIVAWAPYHNPVSLTGFNRQGTLAALGGGSVLTERVLQGAGLPVFLRLTWNTGTTYTLEYSTTGDLWSRLGWTMPANFSGAGNPPTHFGIGWSVWGSGNQGHQGAAEYFRVNPTL